ncbi:MAG: phosphotransferase [Alphaproteobacteria bacterium]|nr:phosphotransferase [Alphaproteobacteria bacterium]
MPLTVYERAEFLKKSGWSGVSGQRIGDDWSQRQYFRIEKNGRTAILMHSVPDYDPKSVAGHRLEDFIKIGKYLKSLGLSVPEIYATELNHGLILMEDLGCQSLNDLMKQGVAQAQDYYLLAAQILEHLSDNARQPPIAIPDYFSSHIYIGKRRVLDWYIPARLGGQNPPDYETGFRMAWQTIERGLPPPLTGLQHGDYHPGNLLYLAERTGIAKLGILDFQGAFLTPIPYDLVNLLEDARKIVPIETKTEVKNHFLNHLKPSERERIEAWYVVLSAQFHCRVIGQAISLAHRKNMTRLMGFIPILEQYLAQELHHPLLRPLAEWFRDVGIDFTNAAHIDLNSLGPLIDPHAF